MDLKLASRTLILAIAGGAFSLTALAQWQWIDKDGRKVYSDRSPPADIPQKNILKAPRGAAMVAQPAANEAPAAAPAAAASSPVAKNDPNAPKLTGKDAQLEAKKKQAEDEAAAKKKAEEDKVAKARAENCEQAKKALASLQSGQRIAVTNAKGEREVMDDKAKAAEINRTQGIMNSECK